MMWRLNLLLAVLVVLSGLWLVRSSHEARRLFVELERAQHAARELQIEHERLEVDKRAQATSMRVEKLAREKLRMFANTPQVTHYLPATGGAAVGGAGALPARAASQVGGRP